MSPRRQLKRKTLVAGDRAVPSTAAWRLAQESVRGMPSADGGERARRLGGSGRLSPCGSTGDPTGPRPYRPRSAFRRAEPLSGARCQTPYGRRDRTTQVETQLASRIGRALTELVESLLDVAGALASAFVLAAQRGVYLGQAAMDIDSRAQ